MAENNNGIIFHGTAIDHRRPFDNSFKALIDSICNAKSKDEPTEQKQESEEWIWVEGYKGTDKDMKCRDYQFKLGDKFDMPEDATIEMCGNGFHLCRDLEDVFSYYDIGGGNRFFKVNALVRKKDYDDYGKRALGWSLRTNDKLVAKSIIFLNELDVDVIFKACDDCRVVDFTHEDKLLAVAEGISKVMRIREEKQLIELGYSPILARYCATNGKYAVAYAVGTQPELSMDMKVFAIMK